MNRRIHKANTTILLVYISGAFSLVFAAAGSAIASRFGGGHVFDMLVGGEGAFFIGTVLGFVLTAFKLALIERMCLKAVDMPPQMGRVYVAGQYLARYLLTGAALFIALTIKEISFLGVASGLLSLRPACLFASVQNGRRADGA